MYKLHTNPKTSSKHHSLTKAEGVSWRLWLVTESPLGTSQLFVKRLTDFRESGA